jgi:hypothetical protein
MKTEANVSIPRCGQRSGALRVLGGMQSWRLGTWQNHPGSAEELFVDGRFDGVIPRVVETGGVLTVSYGMWDGWWRRQHAQVQLNEALPWSVDVRGGVQQLRADLRNCKLRAFRIGGGAQDVVLELGDPHGVVPIEIHGGVANLSITRPKGSAVAVRLQGGAHGLQLDQTAFGSVGGGVAWQSHEEGRDRYELQIGGGAALLVIGTSSASCRAPDPNRAASLVSCF